MNKFRPLVINVTGASSGFGALTARSLAQRGHTVFAGVRTLSPSVSSSIDAFRKEHSGADLRVVAQDMTSDKSVADSVQHMIREAGRIDVVVHNCGHMVYGTTEGFTPEQLAQLYDINVLSTQRLNRAVLPHMRERREGLLLWVGSSSTHGAVPAYLAPYFAAKAGMDALAMSYQLELSQWGIESSIVIPGAYSTGTNHFAHAGTPADASVVAAYEGDAASPGPYGGVAEAMGKAWTKFEPAGADVAEVAEKIADVVGMPHGTRPTRFHVDPTEDGAEIVSGVRDRLRKDRLESAGFEHLLQVKQKQ